MKSLRESLKVEKEQKAKLQKVRHIWWIFYHSRKKLKISPFNSRASSFQWSVKINVMISFNRFFYFCFTTRNFRAILFCFLVLQHSVENPSYLLLQRSGKSSFHKLMLNCRKSIFCRYSSKKGIHSNEFKIRS